MIDWMLITTALLGGLLGGVHCIGMCGGIVGAITLNLPGKPSELRRFGYHLGYNAGRVTSYTIAGALMGGLGLLLVGWVPLQQARAVLYLLAGIFMLLLGLYLSDWWRALAAIERLGTALWRRIEPFARKLLPIRHTRHAFVVGLVWGWLPCGLVYAMLINAVSAGSPAGGAAVMLAFGIGTLPNLLGMGLLTGAAAHLARSTVARTIAGLVMIGFGLVTLYRAYVLLS